MSAISSVWNQTCELPVSVLHQGMLSALEMYGPGCQLSWSDDRIAIGGNFSYSLPEDHFDNQPLWNNDRSACLVADIRLDNRSDLARELGLTHPEELADSAFLMAAWLRWGPSCLDHIVGAFAFAVWTPGRQELFAARDHAGERPLFYCRNQNFFALASMPKGLLALPGVSGGFQESYIAAWLAALPPDGAGSFFEGIDRLPPGHFLRVTPESFERKQYWHPASAKPTRYKRDKEYAEALVEILDSATAARLRSTTPVGSFLSAGLDSSSVTASAALTLAAQGKRLVAFTSVPRPEFNGRVQPCYLPNEGAGAAEVARLHPNVEHVLVDSRGYDLLGTMKAWTDAMDEPFPNIVNALWMTAIPDQARQRGIGVLLEGVVGNNTISWYSWTILSQFLLRGRWLKLARTTHGLHRRGALSLRTAARAATRNLLPMWLTRQLVPAKHVEDLYRCLANPEWMRRYHLEDRIFDFIYDQPSNPLHDQSRLFEMYDLGPIRAAAHAVTQVEMRDPTADKRLFEFCFSIPQDQYVVGGYSRSLVRRAMKGRLPDSVLYRNTRGLQGADWHLILNEAISEMRSELLLTGKSPTARQALDLSAMQTLFDNWPQSGFETERVFMRWHYWLTRALSMGYFLRSHEAAFAPSSAGNDAPVAAPLV